MSICYLFNIFALLLLSIYDITFQLNSYYRPIDDLTSTDNYFDNANFATFNYVEKESKMGKSVINSKLSVIAELDIIAFDVNDMEIHKFDNEDFKGSSTKLTNGIDYSINVDILNYVLPKERYTSHHTTKNLENDSENLKAICSFKGDGLQFNMIESNDKFIYYGVKSYELFNVALNKTKIVVRNTEGSDFISLDRYIDLGNSNFNDTNNLNYTNFHSFDDMDFEDISIIDNYFDDIVFLCARDINNVMHFFEIKSSISTDLAYYHVIHRFKLMSNNSDLFKKATHIDVKYESEDSYLLFVGIEKMGYAIYSLKSVSNKESDINDTSKSNNIEKDNEANNNIFTTSKLASNNFDIELIKSFIDTNFVDYKVNSKTMYVIYKNEGMRILNLKNYEFDQNKLIHPNMNQIDFLNLPLNANSYFVGISLTNNPSEGNEAFFIELIVDIDNEFDFKINKIFTSTKEIIYDNFVTDLTRFTFLFDKSNMRYIILYRGIPNIVDIPSYAIPSKLYKASNLTKSKTSVIYVGDNNNFYRPEFVTQYNGNYSRIFNISPDPFKYNCKFTKTGYYQIAFKGFSSCSHKDKIETNADYCLYNFNKDFIATDENGNVLDNKGNVLSHHSKETNIEEEDENGSNAAVIVIIIAAIILALVIISAILYRYRCFKGKNNNSNQTDAQSIKYTKPNIDANNSSNIKNEEIQIDIKHQPYEDDKI